MPNSAISSHWHTGCSQQRHAAAMGDRDVARVRLRPANPEPLAVLAEQPPDVVRPVREEPPRIGVLRHPPARQPRREAVDRAAAVGAQEATQELPRMAVHDLALPAGELDLAVVLAARTVLGERLRPALARR